MKIKKNVAWLAVIAVPLCFFTHLSHAAICEYSAEEIAKNKFQGEIQITNDSDIVINGWNVSWEYLGDNRIKRSPKAHIHGGNPYTLSNPHHQALIEPGETVSFSFIGSKGHGEALEIPTLFGDVCSTVVTPSLVDIKDAVFVERRADCAIYVNDHDAAVTDLQRELGFNLDLLITADSDTCHFVSNSIPNHDFNDETANFGGPVAEQTLDYTVTRFPEFAEELTPISQEVKNGIMLNGVVLDIISAGCYDPTSPMADADGNVTIGCGSNEPWLLDPLSTQHKFGADQHNAHVQPGGQYHYHGSPKAMYDDNPGRKGSPVIGFAADGFPIYGPYFYDKKMRQVRKARSGYTLKQGTREAIRGINPGGEYTGIYNDDWEFTDAGDLDECNGMTVNGQYGYYAIDEYPWVIKCLVGTPHDSFVLRGGPGGGPGGEAPPAQ